MVASPRIVTLDRHQCLELLASAQVGRLAFAPTGSAALTSTPEGREVAPHVVPVSFVLDRDSVVVRTTHGSHLGRSAPGTAVTFEVDEIRPGLQEGWSVVVSGQATTEEDPTETRRLAGLLQAWAPGFKDLWLRIPLTHLTGRRLVASEQVIQLPESPRPRWREEQGWTPPVRTSAHYTTDFDGR